MFHEITGVVDKSLWIVQAHLQDPTTEAKGKSGKSMRIPCVFIGPTV
jgi:hypothetical protein